MVDICSAAFPDNICDVILSCFFFQFLAGFKVFPDSYQRMASNQKLVLKGKYGGGVFAQIKELAASVIKPLQHWMLGEGMIPTVGYLYRRWTVNPTMFAERQL